MANYTPIRILTGKLSDITDTTIVPGQIYFTTYGDDSSGYKGKIIFDDPATSKRIELHTDVNFATEAGHADTADKATGDQSGKNIQTTYLQNLKFDPTTCQLTFVDGTGKDRVAKLSMAHDHNYAGSDSVGGPANFVKIIQNETENSNLKIPFATTDTTKAAFNFDTGFTYNPSTGTIVADNFSGKARIASSADTVPWTGVSGRPTDIVTAVKNNQNTLSYSVFGGSDKNIGTFAPLDTNSQIPLQYLPAAALERLIVVSTLEDMYKLTAEQVQIGDTVQIGSGEMYRVINDSKLNSAAGYTVYTAGTASKVNWGGVQNRPNLLKNLEIITETNGNNKKTGNALRFTYIKNDGTEGQATLMGFVPLSGTDNATGAISGNLSLASGKTLTVDTISPNSTNLYLNGKVVFDGTSGQYYISDDGATYTGNAASATKATYDSTGTQNIVNTYLKSIYLNGTVLKAKLGNGTDSSAININLADTFLPLTGGTLTGALTISSGGLNLAKDLILSTNIINSPDGPLYIQKSGDAEIYIGSGTYHFTADGSEYSGTAYNAKAAETDGTDVIRDKYISKLTYNNYILTAEDGNASTTGHGSFNLGNSFVKKVGDTMSGDLTISKTDTSQISSLFIKHTTGKAQLVLDRTASSAASYKFINDSGVLRIQSDYIDKKGNYFDMVSIAYNTGNTIFKGNVTAPRFIGLADKATADGANQTITNTYFADVLWSDAEGKASTTTLAFKNGAGTIIDTVDLSTYFVKKSGDTMTGGLTINTGGLSVNGNTSVTGQLGVSSNTTIGGTLGITGNTTVGGTLEVTGSTTLAGLAAGATSLSSLGVSGATSLTTLTVSSTSALQGVVTVGQSGSTATNLKVNGSQTISKNLTITGNLTTNGNTTLGNAAGTDTLTVNAKTTLNGVTSATNGLTVSGGSVDLQVNTTIGDADTDTLTVNATPTFKTSVAIEKSLNVTEDITANDITATGTLNVSSSATIGGMGKINGGLQVYGTIGENLDGAGLGLYVQNGIEGASTLKIGSTSTFGGKLTVSTGGASITGNTEIKNGTLTVAKKLIVSSGGLTVTAGGATITAGGLNVAAGGASINGTTSITGALGVSANATVGGTLGVTGNTSLSTLGVSSNLTVGGTSSLKGIVTIGTADAAANLVVHGNSSLEKNVNIAGTLGVTGLTTLNGGLSVTAGNVEVKEGQQVKIWGTAAAKPLIVRSISGMDDATGEPSDLYLQYQVNAPVHFGTNGTYTISADGSTYSGTANKAVNDAGGSDIQDKYLQSINIYNHTANSCDIQAKDGNGSINSTINLPIDEDGEKASLIINGDQVLKGEKTFTTGITLDGTEVQIKKAGVTNTKFSNGRKYAIIKTSSYGGYSPAYSIKTSSGDWSLGAGTSDVLCWTYTTDTDYNQQKDDNITQMTLTSAGLLTIPSLKVSGAASIDGDVTIGKANTNNLIVNSNTTFKHHVTVGNEATDTLVVTSTSTFNNPVTVANVATFGGDVTFSNVATAQQDQPGLFWKTWGANNNAPYFGFAKDQSDGTFLWSLQGENYAQGLAIGGGSGNLLWKGEIVSTEPWANDTFLPLTGGTLTGALTVNSIVNISDNLTCNATITGNVVKGAVWNDYAEYRESNVLEPGRVVVETGKGDLILASQRLQAGANIISDTFGFSIGETDNCNCPIAVSGRVLAYPLEDRNTFEAGDPVCAGPNGTVSRMTREEVREWPDRIIGTVSEIPEYSTWGTGKVKVNGRIWIKVK